MYKLLRQSAFVILSSSLLAACAGKADLDPAQQSGGAPSLPTEKNFLVPPMQVPTFVGWKDGQVPKVAAGLRIEKVAGDLMHPRQLLTLPNGDVLAVESNGPGSEAVTTPKQLLAGMIKNRSGKGAKGGNRITLLRKSDAANGGWEKHVFIEHLHSPFGVQLIGDTCMSQPPTRFFRSPIKPVTRKSKHPAPSSRICRVR